MRLRLAQIVRQEQSFPLSEKYCLIINSAQYLMDIMSSWSGIPLYLQLELAKYGQDHISGLFKEVIDGFDFFVQDLIKNLADHMYYEVKTRSRMYKDIKWFSYPLLHNDDPCPESLPMLQICASQVDFVDKRLKTGLASQVITLVCDHLSDFYIHEIILLHDFNNHGCQQLKLDIEKGIKAIFSQHVMDESKLTTYKQLRDVVHLLNMKQANALLLMESLSDPKQADCYENMINDVGLRHLDSDQAIKVLRRRVDLK